MDGSLNKLEGIFYIVIMTIWCGKHFENNWFLVANINKDNIILGYLFFKKVNPEIDWPTETLT